MKNSKQDKDKFIAEIITTIQMRVDDFMANLANKQNYETTIYQWSIHLFDEGKSIEEAIAIIQERRAKVMFGHGDTSNTQRNSVMLKNYQKVLKRLQVQSSYLSLEQKQKAKVLLRIDALVATRLYSVPEVITLILNIINHINTKNQPMHYKNKIDPKHNKPMLFSKYRYNMPPKVVGYI